MQEDTWELYYWAYLDESGRTKMMGRGEFVRLMFEISGTPFVDHSIVKNDKNKFVFDYVRGGGNKLQPVFAPPMIKKGDFQLSQTPTIMRYLGKLFDLYPAPEFEWQSDALMGFLTDFVAEGRLVFHAKCFTAPYTTQ